MIIDPITEAIINGSNVAKGATLTFFVLDTAIMFDEENPANEKITRLSEADSDRLGRYANILPIIVVFEMIGEKHCAIFNRMGGAYMLSVQDEYGVIQVRLAHAEEYLGIDGAGSWVAVASYKPYGLS